MISVTVTLPDRGEILLTDTVGFVRKLPHSLVEAFKSTLEEAVLADFLILVLDLSSPQLEAQWETTLAVLKELGAADKDVIVVFNKLDKIDPARETMLLARTRMLFPDSVYLSTRTGAGLEELEKRLCALAGKRRKLLKATLPPERSDLVALAHERGNILECRYRDDGAAELTFTIHETMRHLFDPYLTGGNR